MKTMFGIVLLPISFGCASFLSRSTKVARSRDKWFSEDPWGVQYRDDVPENQVVYRVDLGHQAGAEASHQVGNSTYHLVSEFVVVKVPNGTVCNATGLVVSPDAVVYRMGRWYFDGIDATSVHHDLTTPSSGREYYSAIQIWQYAFQHIVFDTLPRARMACPMLQEGHMTVLVVNDLQAELIQEVCPLPDSRFETQSTTVKGSAIYLPEFRPALEMGLLQHHVLKPLGKPAAPSLIHLQQTERKRRGRIVYLQRPAGHQRSVINEEEVLEVLRATGRDVDVQGHLQNFHTDRALFADADYIVGPHGGAMSNMLFAHPGATIVEFSDVGYPSGLWGFPHENITTGPYGRERARPCFLGLAVALDLRYVPISPLDVNFFSYEHPMRMDVKALEAFFAKEK